MARLQGIKTIIHTMNKLFCTMLFPLLAQAGLAQQQTQPFQAEAVLIFEGGEIQQIWITAATETAIRYRETAVSVDLRDMQISDAQSVYLLEPREYSAARDLFMGRKYQEAKERFAAVKERYRPTSRMRANHSTLSAFYEMECMRMLGDLESLHTAMENFMPDPLERETHRRQVQLYGLWDAVRTKSWPRLEILAKEMTDVPLPGDQRAQVAYCLGMALEGQNRPIEALNAFNTAMTADAGASETIARDAALAVMRIHLADPDVQLAIRQWGTPDERPNSPGHTRLLEAGAVAHLYELTLGAGKPLPEANKALLKYKPEQPAI